MSNYTKQSRNGRRTHTSHEVGTAGLEVPMDPRMMSLAARNNSEGTVIYVSESSDQAEAIASGYPITPGGDFSDSASIGPWYFFTESGTADLRLAIVRSQARP